jgi:hypothetical protein
MISRALAGGLLATFVLTTMIRVSTEAGLTRLDLALILGTVVTQNRRKARAIGSFFHFALGLVFALAYALLFRAIGWSSWWLGALVGVVHTLLVSTVLINIVLPVVHPLMGTPETAASEVALIEPPGFLMRNYGPHTFLVTLVAHVMYGAILGWVVRT